MGLISMGLDAEKAAESYKYATGVQIRQRWLKIGFLPLDGAATKMT